MCTKFNTVLKIVNKPTTTSEYADQKKKKSNDYKTNWSPLLLAIMKE